MTEELERKLKTLALDACKRGRDEIKYHPRKFLRMIAEKGVVQAIKEVIASKQVPKGFITLLENNRLDLSAEFLILKNPEFHSLFTLAELEIARKRLESDK